MVFEKGFLENLPNEELVLSLILAAGADENDFAHGNHSNSDNGTDEYKAEILKRLSK